MNAKLFVLGFAAAVLPASVSAQHGPDQAGIVVTAQRTGVPVWRVSRGGTTLVLFGSINDIAKDTRWSAVALDRTIAQAERVMFPETMTLNANPFQLIGWLAKWKARAKLPKGQSLSTMLTPGERARLQRLAVAGIAPKDWDRFHPLHLSFRMQDIVRKQAGKGEDPESVVRRSMRKHKIRKVPFASIKASPMVKELFATAPAEHLPCLRATLGYAEGGAREIRRRSVAWANRQVASALRTPVDRVYYDCWPGTERPGRTRGRLINTVEQVLASRSGPVVAVFDLTSLAGPGGLLDHLKDTGARVDGPDWR